MIMFNIRRPAFIIFIYAFILSLILIKVDFKNLSDEDYNIKGNIYTIEKINNQKYYLDLYSKNTLIRVYNHGNEANFDKYEIGQVIEVDGKLKNNLNNNDISYGLYLKGKGFDYTLNSKNIRILGVNKNFNFYINKVRDYINNEIIRLYKEFNPLVRALITGDRTDLSKYDRNTLSKSGVSHIISISGFHILLIVGIIDKAFSFVNKNARYFIILLFTFFYIAIIGFEPPCVRAYIFYLTYVLSVLLCERYDTKSICYILASIYISVNRYVIFNMSFALSFLAVFSISTYYRRIRSYFINKPYYDKYRNYIDLIIVTVSAQILTVPYMYYYFNSVSLVSIISNLISVPIISLAYPFIILSLLFSKIEILGTIFSFISSKILDTFLILNRFFIKLPFAYILYQKSYIFIVILLYILIFAENYIYTAKKLTENKIETFK